MDEEQKKGTKETKHRGPEIKIRDRGSRAWEKSVILVVFVLGGPLGKQWLWRSLWSRWRLVKIVPLTVGNGLGWAEQALNGL